MQNSGEVGAGSTAFWAWADRDSRLRDIAHRWRVMKREDILKIMDCGSFGFSCATATAWAAGHQFYQSILFFMVQLMVGLISRAKASIDMD